MRLNPLLLFLFLVPVLKISGEMNICSLKNLVKFQPTYEPHTCDDILTCFTNDFKHFKRSSDLVIIDRYPEEIYILLSPSDGVFLLNRSMEFKRLCDGFMEYIRLAMLHYMIRGWQCFLVGDAEALPYDHVKKKFS